jgi:ABC-type Mn2+/Zn2+ transport system ATPase subunit
VEGLTESIVTENLTVAFDGKRALENITVEIPIPSITAIIGPNGAGKSVFLKSLIGLIKPTSGSISVLGIDPVSHPNNVKRMISYVAQKEKFSYPVPICVYEVVMMGLLASKSIPRMHTRNDDLKVREALKVVDLDDQYERPFDRLSGGQQQRTLLARSIIRKPRVLILDEPFNAVDVSTQSLMIDYLQRLREQQVGIIVVTHDTNPLACLMENIMILNRTLIGFGPPKKTLRPEVLAQVYGNHARVLDDEPCPIIVTGDIHG